MFGKDDLSALLSHQVKPAVTILMPTARAGQEVQQNSIRFDNLCQRAHDLLVAGGLRGDDAQGLLAPARQLASREEFWRKESDVGMAFFLSPGYFRWYAVPLALDERVRAGTVFHFTPLLPLVSHSGSFVIVTASAHQVRVFDAHRNWVRRRETPSMPEGVDEITAEGDFEPEQHAAPQARPRSNRPSGMRATQGANDAEEQRHANLIEYLRRACKVLEDQVLVGHNAPAVLVALPEIQGHFRNLSRLGGLVAEGVQTNPDSLSAEELRDRALPLVESAWFADEAQARARFASIYGAQGGPDGKVSTRPDEIIKAARHGQVECLFVAHDNRLWGHYDADADRLDAHGSPTADDDDLADLAAAETLLHAGQVEVTTRDGLPAGQVMAALLRF